MITSSTTAMEGQNMMKMIRKSAAAMINEGYAAPKRKAFMLVLLYINERS